MSRKSTLFREVPVNKPSRSMFDLSHEVKMSGKFGYLYPVLLQETLPGDTFRDNSSIFIRLAPMLSPIMHRIDVTTHFFFVPNRLLTEHWEDFITGGQDGTLAPVLPYITPNTIEGIAGNSEMVKGSLWDYLGLPVFSGAPPTTYSNQKFSVLPFRACAKIWNDFYRDPNFDTELDLDTELEGNVSAASITAGILNLFRRGWEKDYFTSALPFAQRGAEVLMPLSGTGSVTYKTVSDIKLFGGGTPATGNLSVQGGQLYSDASIPYPAGDSRIENIDEVQLTASDVSINDLRRAIAIQKWLEANARGGARYTEQIMSHFATQVPDYRLQRAEYLGGGKQPVVISEVVATAGSEFDTVESPIGDLAGKGISVGRSNQFTYRCQEHGFIVGFTSVMPRTAYSQGVDRLWTREIKYDYAWPELAHLGEQEIKNKEVMYSFDSDMDTDGDITFGYTPRYSEYKFKNDRIAGDFRDTLAFWHLSRIFTDIPSLDELFTTMYENGDGNAEETYRRIFAVVDGTDYLWMQLYHKLTVKRPLPYFGVPLI